MAAHYSITKGSASEQCLMHYVHECIASKQPISLIAIGGVAALNDCLSIIEQNIGNRTLKINDVDIRITSVEASLYSTTPINNVTPVVNHNPAINPGAESTTEQLKDRLESYGATIQHRSLFSQYHSKKISRTTYAAVSASDHQQKTQLMRALEARYGKLMINHILKSTAQYPVTSKEYDSSPLLSHSSFLHDLKAYYLSSLNNEDILKKQYRLGMMTDNGRIFFTISEDDKKKGIQWINDLVSLCKVAHPDINWLYGDDDEDILIDQRIIIDPDKINDFDESFLQWLENSPSNNRPNSMIITDIGHGGSGSYTCQDWDDPLVILERLREIQYAHCKTLHIMLSQEGRDIGNRMTYTLGLIDLWANKNKTGNLKVKLIIPPSEVSPFEYSQSKLRDQSDNIKILSMIFHEIIQSLKRNSGQMNRDTSTLIESHQKLMHTLANDSSISISEELSKDTTHASKDRSTPLLALAKAKARQATQKQESNAPGYMGATLSSLFKIRATKHNQRTTEHSQRTPSQQPSWH